MLVNAIIDILTHGEYMAKNTVNYTKTEVNTDSGHNKTHDGDGTPDHITDTGDRKTPLVTDGGTKHNVFRVTRSGR